MTPKIWPGAVATLFLSVSAQAGEWGMEEQWFTEVIAVGANRYAVRYDLRHEDKDYEENRESVYLACDYPKSKGVQTYGRRIAVCEATADIVSFRDNKAIENKKCRFYSVYEPAEKKSQCTPRSSAEESERKANAAIIEAGLELRGDEATDVKSKEGLTKLFSPWELGPTSLFTGRIGKLKGPICGVRIVAGNDKVTLTKAISNQSCGGYWLSEAKASADGAFLVVTVRNYTRPASVGWRVSRVAALLLNSPVSRLRTTRTADVCGIEPQIQCTFSFGPQGVVHAPPYGFCQDLTVRSFGSALFARRLDLPKRRGYPSSAHEGQPCLGLAPEPMRRCLFVERARQ